MIEGLSMIPNTKLINNKVYVLDSGRGVWVPLSEMIGTNNYSNGYDNLIEKQSDALADLKETVSDLRNTISVLKSKLNRAAETNNKLACEIDSLNNEIKNLKSVNEKLSTVDKLDFYMKYQYPEDSISPNYSIRKQAAAIKKIYEEKHAQTSDRFSEIKLGTEQHRDNTPEEMIDTFTGIYDIWEKHPELELMELLAKLINSRKGCVPIDDEEFIKALKETYNE